MKRFLLCIPFEINGKLVKDKRRTGKTTKMFKSMLESDQDVNYIIASTSMRAMSCLSDFISYVQDSGIKYKNYHFQKKIEVNEKTFFFVSIDEFEREIIYYRYANAPNIYIDEFRSVVKKIINRNIIFKLEEHIKFVNYSNYGK